MKNNEDESVTVGSQPVPKKKIWKDKFNSFDKEYPGYEIVKDICLTLG